MENSLLALLLSGHRLIFETNTFGHSDSDPILLVALPEPAVAPRVEGALPPTLLVAVRRSQDGHATFWKTF